MQIKVAFPLLIVLTVGLFQLQAERPFASDQPKTVFASPSNGVNSGDAMDHVSPQAKKFITTNSPITLDGPLTPERARQMRKQQSATTEKIMNTLQKAMGYSTREEHIHGIKVLVITPRGYSKSNDSKIALYIHGGGYALKSALDTSAVLMSNELGLRVFSIEY